MSQTTLDYEYAVRDETLFKFIAGVDEAGRGALAGDVVAGAVILPLDDFEKLAALAGVTDSKLLSEKKREIFFELIQENALSWGIGVSSAAVVDEIGIIGATKQAMAKAITCLKPQPEFLLIDGRIRLKNRFPQNSLIRGDRKSLSIAAGSVLAKVARDRKMVALAETYPDYGFERHKGYGTQAHLAAIKKLGPCAVHRRTFAPMRETLV